MAARKLITPPAKTARPVAKKAASKKLAAKKRVARKATAPRDLAKPMPMPAPLPKIESPAAPKVKAKPVRDSFTMPRTDYDLIADLKERALGFRRPTKKSELLRAGLHVLAALDPTQLQQALDRLPLLKSGRPSKASVTSDRPIGVL